EEIVTDEFKIVPRYLAKKLEDPSPTLSNVVLYQILSELCIKHTSDKKQAELQNETLSEILNQVTQMNSIVQQAWSLVNTQAAGSNPAGSGRTNNARMQEDTNNTNKRTRR
ncbi:hypothetical protein BGX26_008281, partial [Mortierella sp. AD094]